MGIQGDHSQDTVTFPTVTALLHMLKCRSYYGTMRVL